MSAFASQALVRSAALGVAGAVACLCVVAGSVQGVSAALGLVAGALLAGVSVVALAQGLAMLLGSGISGASGGRLALISFVVRHVGVAIATYLVLRAGLSAPWFLVGVTTWPIALGLAGLRAHVGFSAVVPTAAERT